MKDLRLRRAAQALFAAIALLFALTACDHGWIGDARLVNRRTGTTDDDSSSSVGGGSGSEEGGTEGEEDGGGGSGEGEGSGGGSTGTIDPFDVNAEWNKIDYAFDGNKLDSNWVLKTATFDTDNIPTYAFSSGSWTQGSDYYTYDASGAGNKAQGFNISDMTVYQYRGKNPLYSGYSDPTKIERFRFYRMTGAIKILTFTAASLDQYLIAVDTYSKFVFAYGKITKTETKGIGSLKQEMPTEYDGIENYGNYKFYEYDPIGYVEESGNVVLYDQYKTDMINASAVNYVPSIHSGYTEMASHSSSGEGRSPYYPGLY